MSERGLSPDTAPRRIDWRLIDWDDYVYVVDVGRGETVSYVDYGTGPAVLLVHGLGASWRVWLENIATLGVDHRVIALDLPGFGSSTHGEATGSYAEYAETLRRLCDELGITSTVVVGNSFGGWVSAAFALTSPELVAGLVLVDAAGIPPTRGEQIRLVPLLKFADRAMPYVSQHRTRLTRRPMVRRGALAFMVARADQLTADLAIHLLPEEPSPLFRKVLDEANRSFSPHWCQKLAAINVPTLVIWGERDRQLPLRHAREWTRLISFSTLTVIPGVGHVPMLEAPERFNEAVIDLLAEVRGRKRPGPRQ